MEDKGNLGYWAVAAIGVGGMVGGGIFAVLGLAVQLSGGGAPVAFALAGGVALITSYSYAKLSVAFPGPGGTVEFLNRAFGVNIATGALNVLLWLSYIVMLALYAHALASYGAAFFPADSQLLWRHVLLSGAVVVLTLLNAMGAAVVGAAESYIVGLKIAILLLFVGVGVGSIDPQPMAPAKWPPAIDLIAGGMIIFVAYEGFELIANTAADVRGNYRVILPRAYYSAVGFVILLYVAVAAVTVGNLSVHEIASARDYALAAAAQPFLGKFGFTLIAVAAVLSTGSAINATLYGAARLSYIVAKEGEAPRWLERKVWQRPIEGLLITAGATLLLANLADLSSISVMGSAGFLILFAAVNLANARSWRQTRSSPILAWIGAATCAAALAALAWQIATVRPAKLLVLPAMVGLAFGIEALYRVSRRRRRRHDRPGT